MANTYRLKKRFFEDEWVIPIASGTVVEIGDLVKKSSGDALRMATSTDNLDFMGVAFQAHGAGDAAGSIRVGKPSGIDTYEYDLDASTSFEVGDLFQFNDAQKLKKSTTDAIAMAVKAGTSVTKAEVVFLIPAKSAGPRAIGDAS
jgi:hypothetical protein